MILLVAGVDWVIQEHEADVALKRLLAGTGTPAEGPGSTGIVVASLLSLAVGISAIGFGGRGRRLAEAEGQGRIMATIGLVLGIVCVAIPILALLAFIAWIGCCIDTSKQDLFLWGRWAGGIAPSAQPRQPSPPTSGSRPCVADRDGLALRRSKN